MGIFYKPASAPGPKVASPAAASASSEVPPAAPALVAAPSAAASMPVGAPPPVPAAARPVPTGHGSESPPPTPPTRRAGRPAPQQELSVGRLALAVGFLMFLLVVGLIASLYKIQPWNSVLPSAFQLLVGAVIGAVIGEKVGTGS